MDAVVEESMEEEVGIEVEEGMVKDSTIIWLKNNMFCRHSLDSILMLLMLIFVL